MAIQGWAAACTTVTTEVMLQAATVNGGVLSLHFLWSTVKHHWPINTFVLSLFNSSFKQSISNSFSKSLLVKWFCACTEHMPKMHAWPLPPLPHPQDCPMLPRATPWSNHFSFSIIHLGEKEHICASVIIPLWTSCWIYPLICHRTSKSRLNEVNCSSSI